MIAYQYKNQIFYRSFKPIKAGSEFLVWYGNQYAEDLGILRKKELKIEIKKLVVNPELLIRGDYYRH